MRYRLHLKHIPADEYPVYMERWAFYPFDQRGDLYDWAHRDWHFHELLRTITNCPAHRTAHGFNSHKNIHDACFAMMAMEAMLFMNADL